LTPRTIRAAALAIALVTLPALAGPFEDGVAAYDRGDYATALREWQPLAEQGDAAAAFDLAVMYEKGTGVAADPAAAAHWYLVAAQHGDADAQARIAALYDGGIGVTADAAQARHWYAALAANPRATPALRERARALAADKAGAEQEVVGYDFGRFVIVHAREGECVIALQGLITDDADRKFEDVVDRTHALGCERPWLMLESPGGGVTDGTVLGREVRNGQFRTITRYDCASICAIIFMGGVERVLAGSRARIGLHQAAITKPDGTRRCYGARADPMKDIDRYVDWALPDTAEQVFAIIARTPCTTVRWIGGQQALDLGLATRIESGDVDLYGPTTAPSGYLAAPPKPQAAAPTTH
jgi:hypothetical protein